MLNDDLITSIIGLVAVAVRANTTALGNIARNFPIFDSLVEILTPNPL